MGPVVGSRDRARWMVCYGVAPSGHGNAASRDGMPGAAIPGQGYRSSVREQKVAETVTLYWRKT